MFFIAYGSGRQSYKERNTYSLNEGWTVKYNEEVYENVDLATFKLPVTNNGDWLVLTNVLPEGISKRSTMTINMVYSVTSVYVGGENVYQYGFEDYETNRLLGYGTAFVNLPDNSGGLPIKITMSVTENNSFSSITTPVVYDAASVYGEYYGDRLFPLGVAVTLIVVGICISAVTFCLYFKSYTMEKLFCVGIFSICIGLWSLCSYNLNYIFTNSLKIKVFLEYFSLYLVLFPMLLYFREDVEARQKRWESLVYYALILVEIQLFVIAFVCQLTNTIHLPAFLRVFQVLMVVVAGYIAYHLLEDLRSSHTHTALSLGYAFLLLVGIRDLAAFNLSKYSKTLGNDGSYKSYIAAGTLVLVMAMLVDFINEMRKRMFKTAETQFLEKIAYVDVLTDLYTRRKCEEVFDAIDKRHYEYALIQFDLNNLKTTNDEYGHEAGDELIKRFADIMRQTFTEGETLGRMGGDEFVVMITDAYDYDIEEKLKLLNENIELDNQGHEDVKVSISTGYALSTEFEAPTAREVYAEADKRMYKQKEAYYKQRGYKRRKYDND